MMKVYATPKLKANRLAPAIIGGIIETVEEKTPKDLDWIENIDIDDKTNYWTITIKPKAAYYPDIILKYNKLTKSKVLKGKLYEIEEQLTQTKEYIENKLYI